MPELAKAAAADKRLHPRIKVNLPGRYMLPNRHENLCTVIEGSASGLALLGPEVGRIGQTVVIYVDQIGRVEGRIARHIDGGFAIKFVGSRRAGEAFANLVAAKARLT